MYVQLRFGIKLKPHIVELGERQNKCPDDRPDTEINGNMTYRRDTCFDADLFRRHFCLYHVMLCARSDDITACFFVCK